MARMTASAAAREVLATHWSGRPAESQLPVDPVHIARTVGINVYQSEFENALSGMLYKADADSGTDIFLNSEHAPVRQRFTCAHELGHYFGMYYSDAGLPDSFVHYRDRRAECGTYAEEIYANNFAAELLMPEDRVREMYKLGFTKIAMASRFKVSVDSMGYRLDNLGIG